MEESLGKMNMYPHIMIMRSCIRNVQVTWDIPEDSGREVAGINKGITQEYRSQLRQQLVDTKLIIPCATIPKIGSTRHNYLRLCFSTAKGFVKYMLVSTFMISIILIH